MENGSGRTKKSLTNITFNLMNNILSIVLAFVSRTVFIHVLGKEYLGLNGLFSNVLSLLSMADLGFNVALVYSFYKPLAENDTKKISGLITFYKRIYNTIAVVIAVIGILLIPFLKYIVNLEQPIDRLNGGVSFFL